MILQEKKAAAFEELRKEAALEATGMINMKELEENKISDIVKPLGLVIHHVRKF